MFNSYTQQGREKSERNGKRWLEGKKYTWSSLKKQEEKKDTQFTANSCMISTKAAENVIEFQTITLLHNTINVYKYKIIVLTAQRD